MSKYQLQYHSLGKWCMYTDNKVYDGAIGRPTVSEDRNIILQLMVDRYKQAYTPMRVVEIPDQDIMVLAQIGNL